MESCKDRPCSVCGEPSVYDYIRHCKKCHSDYNRKNYLEHRKEIVCPK